jgi:hypothetical protein
MLGGAVGGGVLGASLAAILLFYVWTIEGEERDAKRREEDNAAGRDPDRFLPCFVATAVFGPGAPEVVELRKWRDRRLVPFSIGRRLVGFYYVVSPSIARVIDRSAFLKSATRSLLRLFIRLLHVD